MASTNKTSNYNLSQFIGTDKPAWLQDYNQDMSKIDGQMKTNADGIDVVDGKADSNTNNIGNLANLNTQAKTNLVASINEIYTTAGTASGTSEQAANAANAAKDEADALTRYLSITNTGSISPSISGGTLSTTVNDLYYALNADGTLGKIYGRVRFTVNTSGTITLTLPVPAISATEAFTIAGAAYYNNLNTSGVFSIINARDMTINPNGNCVITWSGLASGATVTVWLPPCLYFFTDFGDVLDNN